MYKMISKLTGLHSGGDELFTLRWSVCQSEFRAMRAYGRRRRRGVQGGCTEHIWCNDDRQNITMRMSRHCQSGVLSFCWSFCTAFIRYYNIKCHVVRYAQYTLNTLSEGRGVIYGRWVEDNGWMRPFLYNVTMGARDNKGRKCRAGSTSLILLLQ